MFNWPYDQNGQKKLVVFLTAPVTFLAVSQNPVMGGFWSFGIHFYLYFCERKSKNLPWNIFSLFFLHLWWYFLFLSLLLFLLRSITGAWKPRKFSHKLQNQRVLRSREYLLVWEIGYPGFTLRTNKKCTRIYFELFIRLLLPLNLYCWALCLKREHSTFIDVVHVHDTMISFHCTSLQDIDHSDPGDFGGFSNEILLPGFCGGWAL